MAVDAVLTVTGYRLVGVLQRPMLLCGSSIDMAYFVFTQYGVSLLFLLLSVYEVSLPTGPFVLLLLLVFDPLREISFKKRQPIHDTLTRRTSVARENPSSNSNPMLEETPERQ